MGKYPMKRSEELEEKFLALVSSGKSISDAAKEIGVDRVTIYRWQDEDRNFATRCARAREAQADVMDDRIMEVVNKVEREELKPDAARVILSGLQWRASKLAPKKYGDKLELSGDPGAPLVHKIERVIVKKNEKPDDKHS